MLAQPCKVPATKAQERTDGPVSRPLPVAVSHCWEARPGDRPDKSLGFLTGAFIFLQRQRRADRIDHPGIADAFLLQAQVPRMDIVAKFGE